MIHALLRSVGWQASAARRVQQRGASQIHALWSGQKTFQIEISFDQLMKIVSVTTAQKKSKSIPTVSDITQKSVT